MRRRRMPPGLAALAVVVCCSAPLAGAYGFELTGTWVGRETCKVYDGISARNSVDFGPSNPVRITQTGNSLAVVMVSATLGVTYHGESIGDTAQPRNGRAMMTECRSDTKLSAYSEVVHLDGSADPQIGRLRGESIVRTLFGEVGRCKWRLTRTSTDDPLVTNLCPCCK